MAVDDRSETRSQSERSQEGHAEPSPLVQIVCSACDEVLCSYPGLGFEDSTPIDAWDDHECPRTNGERGAP